MRFLASGAASPHAERQGPASDFCAHAPQDLVVLTQAPILKV